MTFLHWAEGSVAVVGLPAGGSWRRAWTLVYVVRGVGLWGLIFLSALTFPGLPFTAWGLEEDSPAPRATALAVLFAVSVCFFSSADYRGTRVSPTLASGRETSEGVTFSRHSQSCHGD